MCSLVEASPLYNDQSQRRHCGCAEGNVNVSYSDVDKTLRENNTVRREETLSSLKEESLFRKRHVKANY